MRIILVSSHFYPSVGGVERQTEEIAYQLAAKGHQVSVFTTDAVHGKQARLTRLSESYRGFYIERFRYILGVGSFFRLSFGLINKVLFSKYDVLHVHNLHDAHLVPLLFISICKFKPLIITGHNPFVVNDSQRSTALKALIKVHRLAVRYLRWGIKTYIALLPSEAACVQDVLHLSANKIVIIPNGIQDDFYVDAPSRLQLYTDLGINISDWKLIVGTASRLNYVKGIQNLKYAVDQLPKVLFIFAGGDDGYETELNNLYAHNKNVIFTGKYLPTNKMLEFYAGIDIFLLPSNYEPFGMTLVEAAAQGKLVISTNVGGPTEIVTNDFGDLLDPNDYKGWYELINYYSQNKELVSQKSANAKLIAQQYKWENVIEQIIDVYNL